MISLKTPGVYAEEIATLPPSVAEVSTAVPAFIGYTEKGTDVLKINSLLEYEAAYGGAPATAVTVSAALDAKGFPSDLKVEAKGGGQPTPAFLLYYALAHYFQNGGGPCYIVPVGDYGDTIKADAFTDTGLPLLAQEDEPTLIVMPDAVKLGIADYGGVCDAAMLQCATLKDRFLIADVPDGKIDEFRDATGTTGLSYAAAYHPYLQTTLTLQADAADKIPVTVAGEGASSGEFSLAVPSNNKGLLVTCTSNGPNAPKIKIVEGDNADPLTFEIADSPLMLTIGNVQDRPATEIIAGWTTFAGANPAKGYALKLAGDGSALLPETPTDGIDLAKAATRTLADYATLNTGLYNQIRDALGRLRVTLPPSAAVAGVYARVDRSRGVWKAPANESVTRVLAPVTKITDQSQEDLNIDATAGKSINAIRQFTGKGSLIWGARTLAGNDNEWRYVSVRRLFIAIEESTRKASAFAVFEPNDATTWLKVKGMIESYLFSLWEQGALAGAKADEAYYVNVGLGRTMTAQDVLEGRMLVEIGIAAVRPAEFIVLRFSHKLQES